MSLVLLPVVAIAFFVEAALGFGSTLIAVSLGALVVDVPALLPAFVPLNMVLSAWIIVRDRSRVDTRLLWRGVVPAMALGLPVGLLAFRALDADVLRLGLGVLVVLLAARELLRLGRRAGGAVRVAALVGAGAVHGALGAGGPLVVWALGDRVGEPRTLRATLAALWLLLNLVLVAGYAWDGRIGAQSLGWTALCAGGLVAGGIAGELVHRRIDPAKFGRAVWVALAVVGVVLVVR